MAHFAELNENNIVLRVLVVDNFMLLDDNNEESESKGIDFLKSLFGNNTIWKQTSYNRKIRKNYAGIDWTYDPNRDAFINPKPIVEPDMEQYVTFNESSCLWTYNPPEEDLLKVDRI